VFAQHLQVMHGVSDCFRHSISQIPERFAFPVCQW
jgi:hypothetical protein